METTELVTIKASQVSVMAFSIDVDEVKKTVANYALLSVSGIDDKTGLKAVREGRLALRKVRTSIENRRKELKAESMAYGKRVDEVAKELTALVEPTEKLLDERETAVTKEVERLAAAKMKDRMDQLAVYRSVIPASTIEAMDDATFAECLEWSRKNYADARAAERLVAEAVAKKAKEEADAKALEAQRLKEQRDNLEADQVAFRKEQADAAERQRGIDEINRKEAERLKEIARKAEEAEAEQHRQKELERVKKEAAEQAIIEESARVQREAEAAARKEARKPDKEKLVKLANDIERYPLPELSPQSQAIYAAIVDDLAQVANNIRDFIETM